jgi:hypothetical protein
MMPVKPTEERRELSMNSLLRLATEKEAGCFVILNDGRALYISHFSVEMMSSLLRRGKAQSDFCGHVVRLGMKTGEAVTITLNDIKQAYGTLPELMAAMAKQSSEPVSE